MKRIKVNAYTVGLVFRNGMYRRMLKEGSYWLKYSDQVYLYDMTRQFNAPCELNILLQDAALADALHLVEVKDNEIVLQYENGLLKQVLTAGRYAYWKSVLVYDFIRADISKIEISDAIERTVLQNKLVAPYVRSYSVESYE